MTLIFILIRKKRKTIYCGLGRLSKAKNPDGSFMDPKGIKWAIQLAEETDSKLMMSGNIEDMKFYDQDVKPHLSQIR